MREQRRLAAIVLAVKDQESPNKLQFGTFALAACRPLHVQNLYPGVVHLLPACLADALAPVEVLAVHEERLVQQAGLVDSLAPEHHECTDDRPDLRLLVLVDEGQVVAAEAAALRERLCRLRSVP